MSRFKASAAPRIDPSASWQPAARSTLRAAQGNAVKPAASPGRRQTCRSSSHQRSLTKCRLFSTCQWPRTSPRDRPGVTRVGSRLLAKYRVSTVGSPPGGGSHCRPAAARGARGSPAPDARSPPWRRPARAASSPRGRVLSPRRGGGRRGRGGGEGRADRRVQIGLVDLDRQDIVAIGVADRPGQRPLAEQGIAGQDPERGVGGEQRVEVRREDVRLGLLVAADGPVGQDQLQLLGEDVEDVDRVPLAIEGLLAVLPSTAATVGPSSDRTAASQVARAWRNSPTE